MKLLGIDCSTQACSVAVSTGTVVFLKHELLPQHHAKRILFLIDALLKEAKIHSTELDAIAVGIGPGSFTGLRIAASVAQGFAFGLGLPLVPISSLQILAQTAYRTYAEPEVWVAVDARMGEVYWGEYQLDKASGIMVVKKADQLSKPKQCYSNIKLAVGSAFEAYAISACSSAKIDNLLLPKADALLDFAIESVNKKRMIAPDSLQLNYLRNEVVHRQI